MVDGNEVTLLETVVSCEVGGSFVLEAKNDAPNVGHVVSDANLVLEGG